MTPRLRCLTLLGAVLFAGAAVAAPPVSDDALATAEAFVKSSKKYLHHSQLKRGMKGFGRTVLAGVDPVRFEMEIVSVVTQWAPHQDAILVKLSGQGLEGTKVISGMSGSPVYVTDAEGRNPRMIGAVAFGWQAQNEALCGVQPITQMLAIRGVLPGAKPGPATTKKPESGAPKLGHAPKAWLQAALTPQKVDFSCFPLRHLASRVSQGPADGTDGRMVPLMTPLMVSGLRPERLRDLRRQLEPLGICPVQAGGVGAASSKDLERAKLIPGAAVAIPVVSGDLDWSAIGTVTEVLGDKVLGFGHPFLGAGEIEMPIAPAYVHTVMSGMLRSFKFSSAGKPVGALIRDEETGIAGQLGKKVATTPMTVTVEWTGDSRKQRYSYELVRHRMFTSLMVANVIRASAQAWSNLPERHTVRYTVDIDFGKLGHYRCANTSSDRGLGWVASDATRPVGALIDNPLGEPVHAERIDVKIVIEPETTMAVLVKLELDGQIYRPGGTVTGTLTYQQFRRERQTMPIRMKLPENLPEGRYPLTVCDAEQATRIQAREMPHRFNPRTVKELFSALRRIVQTQGSHLYLHVPLPRGGVAIGQRELPDLPPSRAKMIAEANLPDARAFRTSYVRDIKTNFVLEGSVSASLRVQEHPTETLLSR